MNKDLFKSVASQTVGTETVRNNAGGVAYKIADKEAFVKLLSTITFRDSAYVSADTQLQDLIRLSKTVDDVFLAKAIVYSHEVAKMKDVPAVLTVLLSTRNSALTKTVIRRIANARFVCNVVSAVRSGVLGRKSLGARLSKEIEYWLNQLSPLSFIQASISKDGITLKDVISLAHPRPNSLERQTMLAWAMGRVAPQDEVHLPSEFATLKAWQQGQIPTGEAERHIRGMFEYLVGSARTPEQWQFIALQASWTQTVKNLNTFARHGVFHEEYLTESIVARLIDQELIRNSRSNPTQILMAYLSVDPSVPPTVKDALAYAVEQLMFRMDIFQGDVLVGLDVSGSMTTTPATGHDSRGNSSKLNCMQASSLYALATCRMNTRSKFMLFDTSEVSPAKYGVKLHDRVLVNAERLSQIRGGGTYCHLVFERALRDFVPLDAIMLFSDNESWGVRSGGRQSRAHEAWQRYKKAFPNAKLICWDISPNTTKPVNEDKDILYVGGFTTEGLEQATRFLRGSFTTDGTVVKGRTVVETIDLIEL